jgi:uncharacterized repeat protein (TIGR01451 family)
MKKHFALLVAFLATTAFIYTQSYYYDSFDYPVGNLGVATGQVSPAVNPATSLTSSNWNYGSTKSAKVQVGSLTYPGLLTSATSLNDVNLVNTGSAVNQKIILNTITTPVYFSFLMKVKAVPASSVRVASLSGTTNSTGTFAPNVNVAPGTSSGYKITIDGGSGAPLSSTSDMTINNVVLVVVKYTPNASSASATTDVWINPAAANLGAISDPTPTFAAITGGVISNISGFTFKTGLGVVNADIDELRIGNTWANVTPQGGDPVDLSITKSIDNSTPDVGSTVNFTITASNGGYNTATDVSITDILPSGYTFVSATPSTGSWTSPTWTVGSLASAASATLSIVATLNASGDFKNKAYVTKDATDSKQSNDTASVTPSSIGAALPFYEPFNESVGSLSGSNIRNWTVATTYANVVSSPLAYTGLWSTPNSNSVSYGGNISEAIASQKIGFTQQTSGTVYASSIIKVTSLPDATSFMYKYNFGFYNAAGTYAGCVNIFPDPADPTNKFFIGVCKKNNNSYTGSAPYTTANTAITWSASSYSINTPILLIMGYDLTTAGEVMNLWINPDQSTFGAGSAPTATLSDAVTVSTLTTGKNLIGFLFRTGAVSPGMNMDELRIGSSWADVTPPTPTFSSVGSGSTTWSNPLEWTGNVVPVSGANVIVNNALTIDQNVTLNSIEISSEAKLTLNSGNTLSTSTFNINSDATNGTGTFVDLNPNGGLISDNINVQQYLSTARNWYLSSPVSNPLTTAGYTYYKYDEPGNNPHLPIIAPETAYWEKVNTGATFSPGTGYIALPNTTGTTLTFSNQSGGSINAGNVPVILTASGAPSTGFNLIGNPYPCHLGWTYDFANANSSLIESSIWIRTNGGISNNSGQWSFATYNAASSESVPSVANAGIIAPMQSFWVKAKTAGTLILDNKLTRSHQSSNSLKAPAAKNSDRQRLRMEVSNGITTDETLVYFDSSADNGYDVYDSRKFPETNAAVQIYTLAGSENLVINGMSSIPNTELPLGFTATSVGTYSLKALQFSNFVAGTQIILRDYADVNHPVITDLSDGSAYTFASDVASTTTRFTMTFKAPSVATDINSQGNQSTTVFKNANGNITIIKNNTMGEGIVTICNTVGQKLITCSTTGATTVIGKSLTSGVYFVIVDINNCKMTKRIILN